MAEFHSPKYPSLLVVGVGRFANGALTVTDESHLEIMDAVLAHPELDVSKVDPTPETAPSESEDGAEDKEKPAASKTAASRSRAKKSTGK